MSRQDKYPVKRTASLDRIDSEKGYVAGNVHWVHKTVNKMKMEFSVDDFVSVCKEVAEHKSKPAAGK